MRRSPSIWCVLFVALAFTLASAQRAPESAAKPAPPVGAWSGTWEGGGASGGFDLTLEQAKDGPLTGKVAVTGEPAYIAAFTSVSIDGKKLDAKYDFPADQAAEVTLVGTFDGATATGTWVLQAKGTSGEVATGTWTVTKK